MPYNSSERVLICDIDNTLLPQTNRTLAERDSGNAALVELCAAIEAERASSDKPFYFGSATGRTMASHEECELQHPAFAAAAAIMDFKVTSVGAEIHRRTPNGFVAMTNWPAPSDWKREDIAEALAVRPELTLQPPIAQTQHKISYNVAGETDTGHTDYTEKIATRLAELGVAAQIIFSGGEYLDILPKGVNKGAALRHLVGQLGLERSQSEQAMAEVHCIAAGDSMNDCDLLLGADTAILPGNAHASLIDWARSNIAPEKLYIAKAPFAAGILEGMRQRELIA